MRLSQLLSTAGCLTALALTPAAASAAAGVTASSATPGSTQAGAHADFAIDMTFGADDDVRDLVIRLPKGFVGNPQAVGLCTQAQFRTDACPAASQVGTTTVTATVTVNPTLGVRQTQVVTGQVLNLEPLAGEPARLGVLLPSASEAGGLVTTQPVRLQSVVSVRGEDSGLDSTLSGLPRTIESNIGPLPTHIDRIQLHLRGRVGGAPYLTLPTTCTPATTRIVTTSYNGATASSTTAYTPTGCDQLAYAPKIAARLEGAGRGQFPTVTTVVTQEADEATTRKVVVTLPLGIAPAVANLTPACASEAFDAGTCPENTQVGSAVAETPLLAEPLRGAVYLLSPPGGGLPGLGIDLKGVLPVKLRASVSFADARVVSVLDDLPDVPLSRFTLNLGDGPRKLLRSSRDFCAEPGTIDAAFTAQAGREVTTSAPVEAANCTSTPVRADSGDGGGGERVKNRRPKVRAGFAKGGALVVTAKVPRGASRLRRMKVALPRGVRADAGRRLRAAKRSGARRLKVRVAPRHLTVQPRRIGKRAKVTVVAKTRSGRTYRVKARLRA